MKTTLRFHSILVISALLSGVALTACQEEEKTTPATTTPTDGSQSAAQLAGDGLACSVLSSSGTQLDGLGYTRSLTLNANGTYSYYVYFSDHVGCTTSMAAGGSNVAT